MSQKYDGGPAFPVTTANFALAYGMTLRDWFAGQALAGLMAYPGGSASTAERVAATYQIADAMIAERAK